MSKYPSQRVGVFVDVSNMYYSARALYQARVNFQNILEDAVSGRQLVRAIAYVIKADAPEEQAFFDALAKQGWEVRQKGLQVFVGGAKKGDWDIGIAMDILRMAPKLDVVVLVSGDGDYAELVKYAKALGTRVEAMAFGPSASKLLIAEVDAFVDLTKDPGRYIIAGSEKRVRAKMGYGQRGFAAREVGPAVEEFQDLESALAKEAPGKPGAMPTAPMVPSAPPAGAKAPTEETPPAKSARTRRRTPRITV